jgi:hypothetical protein
MRRPHKVVATDAEVTGHGSQEVLATETRIAWMLGDDADLQPYRGSTEQPKAHDCDITQAISIRSDRRQKAAIPGKWPIAVGDPQTR